MEDMCFACSTTIGSPGSRRILNKPGCHLMSMLRALYEELFSLDDIDVVLPVTRLCYVCKKCYRALESYSKAKSNIVGGILNMGKKLCLKEKGSDGATPITDPVSTPTRKRCHEDITHLLKRRRIDTPLRESTSRMHATESPLLTVRMLITMHDSGCFH